MISKKTLVPFSSFLLTAALLSQVSAFKNASDTPSLNISAFTHLAENMREITLNKSEVVDGEETVITKDIIKVIEKEISQKINRTRYSMRVIKAPLKEKTKVVAKIKTQHQLSKPIKPIFVAKTQVEEDLSSFEINNKELINLYALDVEQMAYSKFGATQLAEVYYDDFKDEVVVSQASPELAATEADEVTTSQPATSRELIAESVVPNEATKEEIKEEVKKEEVKEFVAEAKTTIEDKIASDKEDSEMVMFDYSEKTTPTAAKTIDQKLYERPLSEAVQKAINREIGSTPIKKPVQMDTQKIVPRSGGQNFTKIGNEDVDLNSDDNIIYDYSQNKVKSIQKEVSEPSEEVEAFTSTKKVSESHFILSAKEINLNTQKRRQARAFEFIPDYDRSERQDDQGSGEIHFGYSINGEMNTQTGVVQSQGMIPTRVELNFGQKAHFEIPLINEEGMQKFLQKQKLSIEGNLIMLAIDPSIVDSEIDSKYAERFFFDKNLKPMTTASGASFVMYAGVRTGNIMIRYLLNNKEVAQKIVYVGDGEMYFEDPEFINSNRETFIFTTRNLLGQKRKELVINDDAISFFNTNITAKKKALNAYDIKVPTLVSGMRKYLEFKHLRDSIFVGSSKEKEIEIPSNEFIAKVLEMNQVSSLKDRCVVQINLSKDLREVKANGKNRSGEMFVETSYLDKDGNFSRDSSELADKAFIVGDMEGQFNIRLDYTDGSTEFLKTFCSEGTYLVEQL